MKNYLDLIIQRFGKDYKEAGITGEKPHVRYNCPFCLKRRGKQDGDGKLYVNINNGKFFCFKCGAKGRVSRKISVSQSSIYSKLLEMYSSDYTAEDDSNDNMFYVPNIRIEDETVAFNYLKSRGIGRDLINYYNMRLGTNREFGRIVVPNELYGVNEDFTDMFSARSYLGYEPRYLNPDGCKKSNSVFNIKNIRNGGVIKIVEGVITAICAGKDSVATYGSSPSIDQLEKIIEKNPKETYCVLDRDAYKKNEELADKLVSMKISGKVYIVYMPYGIDAADMGTERFNEYVMKNRILYEPGNYRKLISFVKRGEL